MAIKAAEAWMSSDGSVAAFKKKDGGYFYFVNGELLINRQSLLNNPVVAARISTLNLEIMEAKQ